jgi:hypothetical protein
MLDIDGIDAYLGPYDEEALSYRWSNPDPAMDQLASVLMEIAEHASSVGELQAETLMRQWLAVVDESDLDPPTMAIDAGAADGRPRLTESWFCCAEPTVSQLGSLESEA